MKQKKVIISAVLAVCFLSGLVLLCTPLQNPFTDPNNIRIEILSSTLSPGDSVVHTTVDSVINFKANINLLDQQIVQKVVITFGDGADTTILTQSATNDTLSFLHAYSTADTFTLTATAVSGDHQKTGHITVVVKPAALKLFAVSYSGNGSTSGVAPTDSNHYPKSATVTVKGNTGALAQTGHAFSGWSRLANGGGKSYLAADTLIMDSVALILYAKWTIDTFKVSFNSNGGSAVDSQMVTYNAVAKEPAIVPTKASNVFAGWYINAALTALFDFTTPIMADRTLYARWTAGFNVLYNGNNSTGGKAPADSTLYTNGQTVTVQNNSGLLVRAGYTFAGWNTAADGSGTSYNATNTFTIGTASVTLFATWTPNTYTITFDDQSATVAVNPATKTVIVPATTVVTLPTAPTKTGFTFGGWFTAINGGGKAFAADSVVTASDTVYARWIPPNSFLVTFNDQAATTPVNPTSKLVTSPATTIDALPTAPAKTGYTFGGWFTAASGGGTAFTATTPVTANDTIYAKWTQDTYTVTFDAQGATNPATITGVTYGATVTLPTVPAKTGFTFGGWFTAVSGGGTQFLTTTPVNASLTVYAQCIQNIPNTYSVTFDAQGAANPTPITGVASGATVTLPTAPAKTGYTFGGWWTAASGGGTAFTATTPVIATITVYAQWTAITYTITFDDQGATTPVNPTTKTVTAPATTVVSLPAAPAKTGYTFGNWFTAVNGGGNAFTATTTVNASISVYAKWTINTYIVKFNSNGGSAIDSQIINYNSSATEPAVPPTLAGNIFAGWYSNAALTALFDFATPITAARTLYAKWTPVYRVVYNGNNSTGGTVPSDGNTYTNGQSVTVLGNTGNLTRPNYAFRNWNTAAGGGGTTYIGGNTFTMGSINDTLYAQWRPTYTVTFNGQGGTTPTAIAGIDSGALAGTLPTSTLRSYTFTGWLTPSNGAFLASTPVTANITVHANWAVMDTDGNVYTTVTIGNQVWMVENLRTTKYNDGTPILLVPDNGAWLSHPTSPAYCYYNNTTNTDSIKKFGALYNGPAVNTTKLAPAGWHVPDTTEWNTLQNYLIANGYNYDGSTTGNKIAKALAAKTDWDTISNPGAIGNDLKKNNSSGFSALPGGMNDGHSFGVGDYGFWWSATAYGGPNGSYYIGLYHSLSSTYINADGNYRGMSVRLIRDY
ncbi:MAG: InlB B-repeat-containing protein [Chitinivibrionales bacterium]|nr:InlB B-repeat-containing protein [Chitinivibrionales bacterium]